MIDSRTEMRRYMQRDLESFGVPYDIRTRLTHPQLRYQRLLRRTELAWNTWTGVRAPAALLLRAYFIRRSVQIGFTIYPNVCGPGLSLAHWGSVVISPVAIIGENCRIHSDVNIGVGLDGQAPAIGDDCWIGPGAKLFGGITIGNRVKVGANAVVNRSFSDDAVLVGAPARNVLPPTAPSAS